MKKILSILLLLVLMTTACWTGVANVTATAATTEQTECEKNGGHNYTRKINSVAHRGYSMGAPENTLPAYTMAKEKGFYYAECDVSYSSDGVPVLMHLRDISHTSNGSGNVDQLTFNQLRKYDYGSWKGSQFKGTKIPTFEEFIAHCAELDIHPYIELKDHGNFNQQRIQELVNIVKKYGMLRQCTWITFIHDYCYYINNCDPYARLGFLWPNDVNQTIINKALSYKTSNNQVFLDIQYTSLTDNGIELAKKNGLPIEVYTINDETTLLNMEDYISGFTTDGLHGDTVFTEPVGFITDPTCTEVGYTTYICTECGYKHVTDYVDALGHEYDENGDCWRCTFGNRVTTYYVAEGGSDSNNGLTADKPLATVNKAVQLANARGAGKTDVVNVNLSGTVRFGSASIRAHQFTLKLTSPAAAATLTSSDNLALGGPTIFDNVIIDMGANWKYFAFGGNPVTFNGRFTHDWVDVELGRGSAELDVTEELNININGFIRKLGLGNTWYTATYNENCNINFNGTDGDPTAEFIINLGAMQDLGSTVFNKALNITNERVEKFAFTKGSGLEFGVNGYFNFINNATGTTIDNHSFGFSSSQLNKTWVLNNKSTLSKVTPTDKKGYFAVEKGYIAIAKKPGASAVLSNEDGLLLSAGQYEIDFMVCNNHVYSNDYDATCNHCATERDITAEPCQHVFDTPCDAICNNCGQIREVQPHIYDNDTDADCNVCGAVRKFYIDVKDGCKIYPALESGTVNGNFDVHTLENCVGEHPTRLYTYNTYKVADIETISVGANSRIFVQFFDKNGAYAGGSNWKYPGVYYVSNLSGAAKATYFKVTYSGTQGGNDASTPPADGLQFTAHHIYDTSCDDTCNSCGEFRSVSHNYSWIIDQEPTCAENGYKHTECNICGRIINQNTVIAATGNHNYNNSCDATCNVCGGTRVVTHNFKSATCTDPEICSICGVTEGTALGHNYSNGCDADCNRCGVLRATQGHKYFNEVDKTCDICGVERQIIGQHLIEEDGVTYYYVDGEKSNITELVKINGTWYYINAGVWDTSIDTLHKINGKWFLIKGGIWKATTGLEEYKGKTFYVVGGKWKSDVTDLKWIDGKWYYIQYGKWNQSIDTLHKINGKWFLIKKGIWNKTTGLVEYKGKTFLVNGGKWDSSVNTLYKQGSKYIAIKSGKVYEGKAIIAYNGKNFYVNDGFAQTSFSGKVKIGSKTYTVKKGIVK